MAMEINSSLDLFLLGLIQSGVNTPYLFRERARLSIGATLPALQRLEKNSLISRAEKGLRNKQEFAVTATGRRAFDSQLARILQEYRERPPSDSESVFRVASLALRVGKTSDAVAILRAAATARAQRSAIPGTNTLAGNAHDVASTYAGLLSACESARSKAEARVISDLASSLVQSRTKKSRRRTAKKRTS